MAKTTTTLKEFESVFPKLVEDLLAHAQKYNLPQQGQDWLKAVSFRLQEHICILYANHNHLVSICQHNWREMQPGNVCS